MSHQIRVVAAVERRDPSSGIGSRRLREIRRMRWLIEAERNCLEQRSEHCCQTGRLHDLAPNSMRRFASWPSAGCL